MLDEYKGMKVGDLITTYNKGIFRLVSIKRRFYTQEYIDQYRLDQIAGTEYSPIFVYESVSDANGKLVKTKKICECDSYYCGPAIEYINQMRNIVSNLEKLI